MNDRHTKLILTF